MPTPKVTLREELIFLLNHASELEHSLCCSYLFTAMSLKDGVDHDLTEEQFGHVQEWKKTFNQVAVDEMMHLSVVNSLLVAVGAAPHLDRPNFPHDLVYYMPDLLIDLQPFNERTLRHFIAVEQPAGSNLPYPITPEEIRRVEGDMDNEIGPDPHLLESQGDVYGLIASGIRTLARRLGEDGLFIGPPPRAAVTAFFESCGWEPATNLGTTIKDVVQIVEQGEGASGDNPDSHFWKFRRILSEYEMLKEKDPSFEPAFPVLANPFVRTPPEAQGAVNLITDDFAIDVSDLFNESYGALLGLLGRFFALTEETDDEAQVLVDASITAMEAVIWPLGDLLTRLPAGDSFPGKTAGPSFVVRTMHSLPYKTAAWRLLKERFEELGKHAGYLAKRGEADTLLPVQTTLMNIAVMLG
ncbi:MAG TPA: ferritin-like domain-containing protein [Dehalococcoidia bacterium]|nr:ferritin-like domain-containing protein [Dehalococcoidia bacterium]